MTFSPNATHRTRLRAEKRHSHDTVHTVLSAHGFRRRVLGVARSYLRNGWKNVRFTPTTEQ
jgi:hypothetical protein